MQRNGAEGEKASWERLTASSLLFFLLVLLIEGQDQHELPEEGNEIQEEVNAVPEREEPAHSPHCPLSSSRKPQGAVQPGVQQSIPLNESRSISTQ